MNRPFLLCVAALLLIVPSAAATSFIMPDDSELLAKSSAVIIATVERASVEERGHEIETVYDIRVERALKGAAKRNELIQVVSPGGALKDRGVIVEGAAHFAAGERVLLFLTRDGGRWHPTDMTLGKFRFRTSTTGERLLVRDLEDVVGWDRLGRVHREPIRREEPFLRFLEDRVTGRPSSSDYFVEPSAVTLELEAQDVAINATPFPPGTYTVNINGRPTRWPSPNVVVRKRVDQNASGTADGGVSVIQNGLAAWTNECGSNINLTYGGTTPTASVNHDGVNVVEFNDPQNRVDGSWTGSGTIARAFTSYASTHLFDSVTWWNITGVDVVFQNGYPGTHPSFPTAMTHELGHGIGWRHSNAHFTSSNPEVDEPCIPSVEECSNSAIMYAVVNSAFGYNLQTWDINAVQSVYPGNTCGPSCTPPSITVQPLSQPSVPGTVLTLSVSATGTGPLLYQWYRGASGNTSSPVVGATSPSLTFVFAMPAQSFWVRVSNACGSTNSAAAYITPMQTTIRLGGDYNGDGRTDHVVFREGGNWLIAYSTGGTAAVQWGIPGDIPVPGDYDNDRRTDFVVWRPGNGTWYIRYATGATTALQWGVSGDIPVPADYDGDGDADLAVFRPSGGYWLIIGPSGGYSVQWGVSGDIPVPADYNGDRRADIAIFRQGTWFIRYSATNVITPAWGVAGDVPIPGDYSGDGLADLAVYRPASGYWLISASTGTFVQQWGLPGDVPVPGDFNGDRRLDIAVWRPFDGNWLIRDAAVAGGAYVRQWGLQGDMPLTD